MKNLYFALAASLLFFSCKKGNSDSQVPPPNNPFVKFKKVYGGGNYDAAFTCVPAIDGGYVISGISESNDGDITSAHGFSDLWLFKIDASGNIEWSQTYGGSDNEYLAAALVPVTDGYILAGATESTNGNVTISKDEFRQHWLFKVDKLGNILWQKKFSQNEGAQIHSLSKAKNGDLIGSGYVYPPGGPSDAWLFRLTANGDLIWEKVYDDLTEVAVNIAEASNGDLIATGTTIESNNISQIDALLFRTNSAGELKWSKSFGGTATEQGNAILATSDGGALMTGITYSNDGIASGSHGNEDILVIKVDENGNTQWIKLFGGAAGEIDTHCVIETGDYNYMLSATSYSQDGDMPGNKEYDAWILTLDSNGTIIHKQQFGGNNLDIIYALLPLGENKFLAAGISTSTTGDFSGAHGGYEAWVFTYEK